MHQATNCQNRILEYCTTLLETANAPQLKGFDGQANPDAFDEHLYGLDIAATTGIFAKVAGDSVLIVPHPVFAGAKSFARVCTLASVWGCQPVVWAWCGSSFGSRRVTTILEEIRAPRLLDRRYLHSAGGLEALSHERSD